MEKHTDIQQDPHNLPIWPDVLIVKGTDFMPPSTTADTVSETTPRVPILSITTCQRELLTYGS
jgi:hypothetical protein